MVQPPLTSEERNTRRFARFLGAMPEFARRAVAGRTLPTWNGATLDSRIAALMALAEKNGRAFRPSVTVAALRAGYKVTNRTFGLHEEGAVETRDVEITTDDGAIPGRLYRPAGTAGDALPLLVYFHGGGFVIGDIAGYDGLLRFLTVHGGIAFLSVEYRLGPEHRFPRGHEDGFAAFAWAQKNAGALGVDPARIGVSGDSAGGNMSVNISTYALQRGLTPPAYQYLIYPGTDRDDDGHHPSRSAFTSGLPLTNGTMEWFAGNYLNSIDDTRSPLFTPLRAPSLAGTPPTYLLAAGFDPLVDEGRAYADRLRESGISVVYDLRPTLSHAFVNFAGVVPEAKRALRESIEAAAAAMKA
jgi:acetyl esterase